MTYERWFAIAVGQMRLAPDVFAAMTPAEFVYAWLGWAEHEQRRERQAWERGRYGLLPASSWRRKTACR